MPNTPTTPAIRALKQFSAGIIPAFAALGKSFGNSIGVINLSIFFALGATVTTQFTPEMFTPEILALAVTCFIGVAFISIFMEGLKNWRFFYKKLKGEELTDAKDEKQTKVNNGALNLLGFLLWLFTYVLPFAGGLAKGATLAFGTYVILTTLASSVMNASLASSFLGIALACGVVIMLISLAREGKDSHERLKAKINQGFFGYENPNDEHATSTLDQVDQNMRDGLTAIVTWIARILLFPLTLPAYLLLKVDAVRSAKLVNEFVSWIPSMLAAIGKGLGNAFGLVKIVGFGMTLGYGMEVDLLANFATYLPIVIPIVAVVALFEFMICMTFEGNALRQHSQRAINHTLGIAETEIPIEDKSGIARGLQYVLHQLPMLIRVPLAYAIVWIPAIAKGATMGFGALKAIEVLSSNAIQIQTIFSTPVGWALFITISLAALAVALVSYTGEGKEFLKWAGVEEDSTPAADQPQNKAAGPVVEEQEPLLENKQTEVQYHIEGNEELPRNTPENEDEEYSVPLSPHEALGSPPTHAVRSTTSLTPRSGSMNALYGPNEKDNIQLKEDSNNIELDLSLSEESSINYPPTATMTSRPLPTSSLNLGVIPTQSPNLVFSPTSGNPSS